MLKSKLCTASASEQTSDLIPTPVIRVENFASFIIFFIEELETNSKVNNVRDLYRGINDFKKGYQPRTIIVKDDKGDLVADPDSIMARWRNYFSQLLNVHEDNDVRQAEIHTVELVPEYKCL